MSRCVRCTGEFSFFDGFLTTAGMVCPLCREKETLRKKLDHLPWSEPPLAILAVLTDMDLEAATRLAEIDPTSRPLTIALACRAIEMNAPTDRIPADLAAEAAVELFERSPRASLLRYLLEAGRVEEAAARVEKTAPEANDEWLAILEEVDRRGAREAAVQAALRLKGLVARNLLSFLARRVTPEMSEAIAGWIERARVVSPDPWGEFFRDLRSRVDEGALTTPFYDDLLRRAAAKFSSTGNDLWLLHLVGETTHLRQRLAESEVSTSLLTVCGKLAKAGHASTIMEFLERVAAPGPMAEPTVELAEAIAAQEPSLAGARNRILEACGLWARAAQAAAPEELPQLRDRCRAAMRQSEGEFLERIGRAVKAAAGGNAGEAHLLLAAAIERGTISPVARRSARAIDLVITAAELDAAGSTLAALEVLAKRRESRRPPLADRGETARALSSLLLAFSSKVAQLLEDDRSPFTPLLLPVGLDPMGISEAKQLDDARKQRFEAAAEITERDLTEAALIRPTFVTHFASLLALACDAVAPPEKPRVLARWSVYGILARRGMAPALPDEEQRKPIMERKVVAHCALRAVAFLPRSEQRDVRRCSDFWQRFSGLLRTLDYYSTGVRPLDESLPGWLTIDHPSPAGWSPASSDRLPPIDGEKSVAPEDFYTSTEIDLSRAPKQGW